jgi:UDP-glucuronate decarboxylase
LPTRTLRDVKSVIVTGGAGFVGSHLVEALAARGDSRVFVLDDFSTGSLDNVVSRNNVEVHHYDVCQPKWHVDDVVEEIDEIYHLACPASPVAYQRDPIKTLETCFAGTKNMLEIARSRRARFLLASTSEVYGDPDEHPQREDYPGRVRSTGPRSCYDEGKRAAESLCAGYRNLDVDARIARIFNTYGPRMAIDDGRLVSNLVVQALRGESLTVYGDGSQTRSLCYVDDLVRGLIALMEAPDVDAAPVNLGNPDERSVVDIAAAILELTGSRGIVSQPLPVDDPRRRCPDIARARRLLNWEPKIELFDGLKRTIDYFGARLGVR